jgi:hypothetical protein
MKVVDVMTWHVQACGRARGRKARGASPEAVAATLAAICQPRARERAVAA